MIKICPDPHCEAVYHNIDKKVTRCNDCGGWIIKINKETYMKKFMYNFFQYDENFELTTPMKLGYEMQAELFE